jgi:glycosyltransferase involved in cell wall biosynthesis
MRLLLGTPILGDTPEALPVDDVISVGSLAELVNHVWRTSGDHVLAVGNTVVVPSSFLDRAVAAVDDDMRIATVSFLSNVAAHYTFPTRDAPSLRAADGSDEAVITRRLRTMKPEPAMAPIVLPEGAAVLISSSALGAVGEMTAHPSGSMQTMLTDFSLRSRRRGFVDLLDAGTYVTRPAEISTDQEMLIASERVEMDALMARNPYFGDFLGRELTSASSPAALAHSAARAKIIGLSIVIEAHCLGPLETGTQVQTLALIKALAERDDVARVGVSLAIPPPAYAQEVLHAAKVEPRITPIEDLAAFGSVDIAHRTYQPDAVDVRAWRRTASRILVTIQDLIAYQVGAYHASGIDWLSYRDSMNAAARAADGVVVVSEDTAMQLSRESFPIETTRTFVVPNGTDHLTGNELAQVPSELVVRGAGDSEFVLMLGTNYAHKNRDRGIEAWRELRERGLRHTLVLAGAQVAYGSSRIEEAIAGGTQPGVMILPDVTSSERNWLLRHASLLLYPTAAEGFGLVPFEAAQFGTPTVAIPFGPLREVNPHAPLWASDWGASSLADAAEALLRDPGYARDQVAATVAAGASYTWAHTASRLVEAYRTVLSWPARA